jgi:hypothetical protein
MTKEELDRRVAELADAHNGRDFVAAIERLAGDLRPDERALLEQVLLERSADGFRDAIAARVEAGGWFRRQWDKLDPGNRPPRR